jgi:transposase, IS30 family
MPPSQLAPSTPPPTGRYLSVVEREQIALLRSQRQGVREIARRLARSASTISRELRRNAATRNGGFEYRAIAAQSHADRAARRPKPAKLAVHAALRSYVQDRLAGKVATPAGKSIAGPVVAWKGRRHGPRQPRHWARAWSPEQISRRLPIDFPEDTSMRVSHEAIYQALYIQGRGALRRELTACLRTGRALRVPRERTRGRGKSFITPEILISERPAIVDDRAIPGYWEGDLIVGLRSSDVGRAKHAVYDVAASATASRTRAAGTRQTRASTCRTRCRGRARCDRAGHGIAADPAATLIDVGSRSRDESACTARNRHRVEGLLLRPTSPWQRGTNENTNGLLRQYFPKGTDLSIHRASDLHAVALALNTRPRKTLNWRTPAEALNEVLRSAHESGVATTS